MKKSWSNTALVAYSRMPKIVKNIDNAVKTRVNSAFQGVHLKNGVTNEKLINEIIKLNDEKRKACNLVFIVESGLKRLPEHEKSVLTERLWHGKTFKTIAEETNKPIRTLFRWFSSGEKRFSAALATLGYGECWFEKEYSDCPLLVGIKKRLDEEKYHVELKENNCD